MPHTLTISAYEMLIIAVTRQARNAAAVGSSRLMQREELALHIRSP